MREVYIKAQCSCCSHGTSLGHDEVICVKRGIMRSDGVCKSFYRISENKEMNLPIEKPEETAPPNLLGAYGDPALWAQSTLTPSEDMNLVKIFEVKPNKVIAAETIRQRIWLHDVLDDNKTPYHLDIIGYWRTRKKFAEYQVIYVQEKHRKKARRLINEYKNAADLSPLDFDETIPDERTDGGLHQIRCKSCGKEFDFDYYKCPFCKTVCV